MFKEEFDALSFKSFFFFVFNSRVFAAHQRFPDRRIVQHRDLGTFPIISSLVTVCLEFKKVFSSDY